MGHSVIEINGKQYDAASGALLGERRIKATPPAHSDNTSRVGNSIDGFLSTKRPSKTSRASSHSKHSRDLQAHKPQRPDTLMRRVVSKPEINLKPLIKTSPPAEIMAKPASELDNTLERKLFVGQINPTRMARSRLILKSQHIQRFGGYVHGGRQPDQVKPVELSTTSNGRSSSQAPQQLPPRSKASELFETAMAKAESHQQPLHKRNDKRYLKRKRLVNALAGSTAVLVLVGFLAYVNMTSIEFKIASVNAGFAAHMPGYTPTGYAMDSKLQTAKGTVAITFHSGDSYYNVTQAVSNLDNNSLLAQDVSNYGTTPHQTIKSKGLTIYIYNGSNANWVNNGVKYQLNGDAFLDTSQVVSIATNM